MISEISHNLIPIAIHEQGGKTTSSFFGRIISMNWDKAHLLANLVLVISGIAYAFFMKLPPLIMFSFGAYGCLVVLLYAKAQKARPSQGQIDDLSDKLEVVKEKNTILQQKFKAEMSANGVADDLREEIETSAHKLAVQAASKRRYEGQIGALRTEKKSLQNAIDKLKRAIDSLSQNAGPDERRALEKIRRRVFG